MGLKLVIFEFDVKLASTGSKRIADHYLKLTLDLLTLQKIKIIEIGPHRRSGESFEITSQLDRIAPWGGAIPVYFKNS